MATIIDNGGGGGTGIIAGVALVALVVVVLFFVFGGRLDFGGGTKTVDIDVPAVTVKTTPDGQ